MSAPRAVVVTGANGFLGRHVCQDFVARRIPVRGLVRAHDSGLPRGVQPVVARDLTDRPALRCALQGVDTVVHLAARVHVMRDTASDPLTAFREVNVDGTRALLEDAIDQGVERFVFVSSVKAIGEGGEIAMTEATPPAPSDPYGVSKLEAEAVVRSLAQDAGIHAPILRLPIVYGVGMKANMLRLFQLVDRGLPLPLGRVRNARSMAYVGNVVHAIATVLDCPAAAHETFLVSDGEDFSTPELIRLIARALGTRPRLLPVPTSLMRAVGRMGDLVGTVVPTPVNTAALDRLLGSLVVDSTKLRRVTRYVPPFSVAQGMEITAQWYRNGRI